MSPERHAAQLTTCLRPQPVAAHTRAQTSLAAVALLARRRTLLARVLLCSQHSSRCLSLPKLCSRASSTSATAAMASTTASSAPTAAAPTAPSKTTAPPRRCGERARSHSPHACLHANTALPHMQAPDASTPSLTTRGLHASIRGPRDTRVSRTSRAREEATAHGRRDHPRHESRLDRQPSGLSVST